MSTETDQPAAGGIPGLRYSEDSTGKKSLEFDGQICGLERVGDTLVSSGPISAPSISGGSVSVGLASDTTPAASRIAKTGRRVLICGSSSSANCSTTAVLAASTSEFNEYLPGYWIWANAVCSGDFALAYNASLAGSGDSASLTRLQSALSNYANDVDIVIIQFVANDILSVAYDPTYTLRAARLVLSYGLIAVIDVPHMRNPSAIDIAKYRAYRDYIKTNIIDAYPGRAFIADRFHHLSEVYGGATPIEWLSSDGVHLNNLGAYYAGTLAYAPVLRQIGGPSLPFPGPRNSGYGTPVAVLDGANATAANVTVTAIDDTPEGVPQWELVSLAGSASATLTLAVTGLDTAKRYRLFPDFDIIDSAAVPASSSTCGVKWSAPNRRFGVGTLAGTESVLPQDVRMTTMAAEFVPSATSGSITLYVGNTGAKMRLRSVGIYESQ